MHFYETFHPSIKEMFAVLGLSSFPDNLTVFTSYQLENMS